MTKAGEPILTDENSDQAAYDMMRALANLARDKRAAIYVGSECFDFIVGQGAVVKTAVDICRGHANDSATLEIAGYKFISSKYGRKATAEEFEAEVQAQRAKL